MAKKIDEKVAKLLDYLKEFQTQNGFPPSVREICSALNINSTSTVTYYLNHLEKNGKIKRSANKNRAIEILNSLDNTTNNNLSNLEIIKNYSPIPLLGNITAGAPILAVENYEEVFYMPAGLFRGDNLFMLTVQGESMINAGIMDGDKVIIRKTETAENGEIVAVLVDDCATIKRFYKENGHYRLQPENSTMEPFFFDEVTILGKVVGLIRNL